MKVAFGNRMYFRFFLPVFSFRFLNQNKRVDSVFESHRNFLANEREPPSSFSLPHLLPSPISLLIFSISPISPSSFSLPLLLLSSYLFPLLSPSELYFGFYDLNRPVARRIFISYLGEIFISIFKNRTDEELGERRTDGGTDGWTHCGRRTNRWAYKGVKDGRIDRRTTNDEVDGRTERLTVGRNHYYTAICKRHDRSEEGRG